MKIILILIALKALLALILAIPAVRRVLVSKYIMRLYKKMMPPMSKTEKEALEAGTTWWESEIFSGRPNWEKLLSLPEVKLTAEEKNFLDCQVEELCGILDDWKICGELKDLPPEVWRFMKEKGFLGIVIPKQYGGLGFSAYAHSQIVMKIASRSVTASVTVMVPNSLGPAELLLHFGTEEQKNYYLPRLASGEEIPCFALTEPEAGSDAGSMKAKGVACKGMFEGKETLGVSLDWSKRYITLGPVATILGLAFKLSDPNGLLGKEKDRGITIALIPTNTKGVLIGERHNPLNIPFQVGPNYGKNVFIPLDWILGGKNQIGNGWKMLMSCLGVGRSISLPALNTGSEKLVARAVGDYARVRRQFGLPIGKFEGIKEKLAQIAVNTYVSDAARKFTALAVMQGGKPSVASAIIKYHITEMGRETINAGMDIMGGKGICLGPKNLLGITYMGTPVSITVEGANILTRNLIIFGQGAIRSHPYIKEEMKAVANPDKKQGLKDFDKAFFGHLGFIIKNGWRTFYLGATGARWGDYPKYRHPGTDYYFKQLGRMSAAFAFIADVSFFVLGGEIKRKEALSARLADVLSEIYLASAALKQQFQGKNSEDIPILELACQNSLYDIQEKLDGFLRNFPNSLISKILKHLAFPNGKTYNPALDNLNFKAADALLILSQTRYRLTEGIYVPQSTEEPLGLLEDAFINAQYAEKAEKRIQKAVKNKVLKTASVDEAAAKGIISQKEEKLLRLLEKQVNEIIQVDAFGENKNAEQSVYFIREEE